MAIIQAPSGHLLATRDSSFTIISLEHNTQSLEHFVENNSKYLLALKDCGCGTDSDMEAKVFKMFLKKVETLNL